MAHPRTPLQDFSGHSNGNNTTSLCPRSELYTEFDFEAAQAPEGIDARGGGFGDDLFLANFKAEFFVNARHLINDTSLVGSNRRSTFPAY